MRAIVFVVLAVPAFAQVHHPSWWTWVEPDASALVGIRWEALRGTKVESVMEGALFGLDRLNLPPLECLKQSEQILLSGPRLEALSWGGCSLPQLRDQAARKGYRRISFKGTELWTSTNWTLAHLGAKLVLAGPRRLVEDTLESAASEEGRKYTPLLAEAAQRKNQNLWIVSVGTVPIALAALSELENDANHPEALVVTKEHAAPKPEPIRMVTSNSTAMVTVVAPPAELPRSPAPVKPAQPRRVVRITGLDEGPKEIELPQR